MAKGRVRKKHVPQRTCVACRQVRGKRDMIRVVRTPSGEVQVDSTGKLGGRGAYLCRSRECWEMALAQRRLQYALKTELDDHVRDQLSKFMQSLPENSES